MSVAPMDVYSRLFNIKSPDPDSECPICFEKLCDARTFCGHVFHKSCICKSFVSDVRCPLCRSEVLVIRGIYTGPGIIEGDELYIPALWRSIFSPAKFTRRLLEAQERGLIFTVNRGGISETGLIPVAYTKFDAHQIGYVYALSESLGRFGL